MVRSAAKAEMRGIEEQCGVFQFVLLKLAARCNINCTYCYWFRDTSVYALPKILPLEVEEKFIERLRHHITAFRIPSFSILFHGGEPLLFGKPRLRAFCDKLRSLEENTGAEIRKSITTNGILVDEEWSQLFKEFGISVTLSIDGAEAQHNLYRMDFHGQGTYNSVVVALALLRKSGLEPGVLAVCDPNSSPEDLCKTFVDELGLKSFDVLVPDATYDDKVISIENYYKKLFDLWFDKYSYMGIEIRCVENMIRSSMGLPSTTKAIGYGPLSILTMSTDGCLEPLDVLRIAGSGFTRTTYNVKDHQFQDVQNDPKWRDAWHASLNLCEICKRCEFHDTCGGGYLPSRWSKQRGYDNPSVYCEDLKGIFRHIQRRVLPSLYFQPGEMPRST